MHGEVNLVVLRYIAKLVAKNGVEVVIVDRVYYIPDVCIVYKPSTGRAVHYGFTPSNIGCYSQECLVCVYRGNAPVS